MASGPPPRTYATLRSHIPAMSDKYQGFVGLPDRQAAGQEPRPARPDPARPLRPPGDPLVDGTVAVGGTGRLAESLPGPPRPARHRLGRAGTEPRRREVQGLVFDATGLTDVRASSARCATSSPRCCAASRPARASSCSAPRPSRRAAPSGSPSGRSRASPAASARRSAAAARSSSSTSPRAPRRAVTSTLAFLLSPKSAYVSGQVVRIGPPARPGAGRGRRLDAPAGRQGRARHRRQPRHRRADRPGAAPRRRDRRRARRPAGRQRAAGADEGARRRPPHPRHHRQGRPAADRPPPQGEARRRRRRRPQRRHHPRQEARQHGARTAGTR